MSPFPFRSEDWDRVKEASLELVNASAADDPSLVASRFVELQAVLGELRAKYGEHPVLLETEADFCDDELGAGCSWYFQSSFSARKLTGVFRSRFFRQP